jgi:hypothetical protein
MEGNCPPFLTFTHFTGYYLGNGMTPTKKSFEEFDFKALFC